MFFSHDRGWEGAKRKWPICDGGMDGRWRRTRSVGHVVDRRGCRRRLVAILFPCPQSSLAALTHSLSHFPLAAFGMGEREARDGGGCRRHRMQQARGRCDTNKKYRGAKMAVASIRALMARPIEQSEHPQRAHHNFSGEPTKTVTASRYSYAH